MTLRGGFQGTESLDALQRFAERREEILKEEECSDLERSDRFAERLRSVDPTRARLLAVHLMVEESINGVLQEALDHPEVVLNGRLGFDLKVMLAKAVSFEDHESVAWALIGRLNTARNKAVHLAGSSEGSRSFGAAMTALRTEYAKLIPDEREDETLALLLAVGALCMGFLSSCRREARLKREWIQCLASLTGEDPRPS